MTSGTGELEVVATVRYASVAERRNLTECMFMRWGALSGLGVGARHYVPYRAVRVVGGALQVLWESLSNGTGHAVGDRGSERFYVDVNCVEDASRMRVHWQNSVLPYGANGVRTCDASGMHGSSGPGHEGGDTGTRSLQTRGGCPSGYDCDTGSATVGRYQYTSSEMYDRSIGPSELLMWSFVGPHEDGLGGLASESGCGRGDNLLHNGAGLFIHAMGVTSERGMVMRDSGPVRGTCKAHKDVNASAQSGLRPAASGRSSPWTCPFTSGA